MKFNLNPFKKKTLSDDEVIVEATKKRKKYFDIVTKVFTTYGLSVINNSLAAIGITITPRNDGKLIFVIAGVNSGQDSKIVKIFDPKDGISNNVVIYIDRTRGIFYNVLDKDKRVVRVVNSEISAEEPGLVTIIPSANNCFIQGVNNGK